jgi:hypothetical protein
VSCTVAQKVLRVVVVRRLSPDQHADLTEGRKYIQGSIRSITLHRKKANGERHMYETRFKIWSRP